MSDDKVRQEILQKIRETVADADVQELGGATLAALGNIGAALLRDLFAAHAAGCMCTNAGWLILKNEDVARIAANAYAVADAMLERRKT